MMNITIKLNKVELRRWYRAVNLLEKQALTELDENPKRNAIGYSNLVTRNITMQKGMSGYAPYSERYEQWKERYGRGGGYWSLFGDLVRSITHFRVADSRMGVRAWMGGIPPNMVDSGGKSWFGRGDIGPPKKIAMYGYVMEKGGRWPKAGSHPPRPIFAPTAEEYQNVFWWKEFEKSRIRIRDKWR